MGDRRASRTSEQDVQSGFDCCAITVTVDMDEELSNDLVEPMHTCSNDRVDVWSI